MVSTLVKEIHRSRRICSLPDMFCSRHADTKTQIFGHVEIMKCSSFPNFTDLT